MKGVKQGLQRKNAATWGQKPLVAGRVAFEICVISAEEDIRMSSGEPGETAE
jgi:hypothetical protein